MADDKILLSQLQKAGDSPATQEVQARLSTRYGPQPTYKPVLATPDMSKYTNKTTGGDTHLDQYNRAKRAN